MAAHQPRNRLHRKPNKTGVRQILAQSPKISGLKTSNTSFPKILTTLEPFEVLDCDNISKT